MIIKPVYNINITCMTSPTRFSFDNSTMMHGNLPLLMLNSNTHRENNVHRSQIYSESQMTNRQFVDKPLLLSKYSQLNRPTYRRHSGQDLNSINTHRAYYAHNSFAPILQSSQQKHEQGQPLVQQLKQISTHELQTYYKQIQLILNAQNSNLKQHNKYLIEVINGMQKKAKKNGNHIKEQQKRINQLVKQKSMYRQKVLELQQFIDEKYRDSMLGLYESPCLTRKIETLPTPATPNAQQFFQISNSNLENQQNLLKSPQMSAFNKKPVIPWSPSQNLLPLPPNPNPQQSKQTIAQLNDQFQYLMTKYKQNHDHNARKQCVKLALEIKQLRSVTQPDITYTSRRKSQNTTGDRKSIKLINERRRNSSHVKQRESIEFSEN